MVNVLIAEDEHYARKVLIKLLQEMEEEIEICCAADTGKIAIEYLATHQVDLVITDIRMPEADGLEVAEYASKHCKATDVIIQSGYSDFHYAQKAIAYGVKSYLTKPVKKSELEETIGRIVTDRKKQRTENILAESLKYLTINDIVKNESLLARFKEECDHFFDSCPYRLFLIQATEKLPDDDRKCFLTSTKQRSLDLQAFTFYFHQSDEIVLLFFGEAKGLESHRLTNRLAQLLKQIPGGGTCGASRIYNRPKQLAEAYRDSIYAINRRLLAGSGQVYEYEQEMPFLQIISKEQEVTLYESVLKYNFTQAAVVIEHLFDYCSRHGTDIYSFYSGIMQVFTIINQAYCHREPDGDNKENYSYLLFSFKTELSSYRRQEDLKGYILGILNNTCGKKEAPEKHNMIEDIKKYVAYNFRQDISLNELATHKYFLNPSYLSRLFKAETGLNFSKYLIKYRMERAQELLGNTSFKINEISDIVGYNDTSYFIQTFKREFGRTPEQYRNQMEER